MGHDITFYDIPSSLKSEMQWSPNTLKTRLTLGVKGIPFETEWREYPDIAPFAKEIAAKPAMMHGKSTYTLPLIKDASTGAVVSDSIVIAQYLDAQYPDTHRLFPDGSVVLQHAFQLATADLFKGWWMPILPRSHAVLNPRSQEYFRRTREQYYGKPLEQFSPRGSAENEAHWAEIKKGMGVLNGWFEKNKPGQKWVMGDTITYTDVTIAAYLTWFKIVMPKEEWEELAGWHGGRWATFVKDFEKYNVSG